MNTLPVPNSCCAPCDEVPNVQVPGSPGSDGLDGAAGAAGSNAYTTTTAAFTMPAEGATVSVSVLDSSWMVIGQIEYVQTAGYMEVSSLPNANTAVLRNPENTAASTYAGNAAPGTNIPASSKIAPGGVQGPSGTLSGAAGGDLKGTYPNPLLSKANTKGMMIVGDGTDAQNFSVGADDLIVHAESGVALGVQYRAIDRTGVNTAHTGATPIAGGGTGQTTQLAAFNALSPLTTRGDIPYRDATNNVRKALGALSTVLQSDGTDLVYALLTALNFDPAAKFLGASGLLGSFIGANFNSVADQAITMAATRYIIRRIVVTNASVNMGASVAQGGFYSNAGKAGTIIVAAAQLYTALTTSAKFLDATLTAVMGTDVLTAGTIYLSLSTAHGGAATGNVFVFGENVA